MQESVLMKVIVIGDSGVGKTNLITRLCQDSFSQCYTATIGVDFKLKTIPYNGIKYRLQIWDTAGQERFQNLTSAYYKNANGILLVYSITDCKSFKNIGKWLNQIENSAPERCSIVIIGAKLDLEAQREVTCEEGLCCAQKFGADWIEISSKSGNGVFKAFELLIEKIHKETSGGQMIKKDKGDTCAINSRRNGKQQCKC